MLQLLETGPVLYGFADDTERLLFRKVTAVKGIGAKTALSLLRSLRVGDFVTAIEKSDVSLLSNVPGIGKKTAERLCFELKGKLDEFLFLPGEETKGGARAPCDISSVVLEALLGLGFTRSEATVGLNRASLRLKDGVADEGLWLQEALRELKKKLR